MLENLTPRSAAPVHAPMMPPGAMLRAVVNNRGSGMMEQTTLILILQSTRVRG
jgi:hypothetical protein